MEISGKLPSSKTLSAPVSGVLATGTLEFFSIFSCVDASSGLLLPSVPPQAVSADAARLKPAWRLNFPKALRRRGAASLRNFSA